MASPSNSTKRRLVMTFFAVSIVVFLLIIRVGYLQIVQGEELKKGALEQWTSGIEIKPKRGIIYDRNGKKLAVSVSTYTVWCNPAEIDKDNAEETAKKVAKILDMDEDEVYEKITKKQRVGKIKQWIDKEEADALRKENLPGIQVVDDNKRYYPYDQFAGHILGFTDIDNNGLYGIERTFDKYLSGTPGKWVRATDAEGRQLPYGGEQILEAKNGLSVVLTLDENIQHFAERAANEALISNKAKNVSVIVMDPNTGDLLGMATKPDYNPNSPREPLDDEMAKKWENLSQEEIQKEWYDIWRNFSINDAYEPGSTFKIITAAAGLEENIVTPESQFYCSGHIKDIPGANLRCWRYYNPHKDQTFAEGVENSCNVVFVDVARRLGREKMYEYIKSFGFGENTGIDLTGEQAGIIPANSDVIKEVNLATLSYGHGIAVTPMQLVTAVSAVSNGGDLIKPRLVKELVDEDGSVVHEFKPEVKRKVISEKTSKTLLEILESAVANGTGNRAYVPGYRIGGKTGTAQKVVDGRYAQGKYISSFVGVAPADDPEVVVLVVVDEPSFGSHTGGITAAPVAGDVIEQTLKYLDIEPKYTEEEKEELESAVEVPDVRNKTILEASKILSDFGFKYNTEPPNIGENATVIDQFPTPGTKVTKGSTIELYFSD